ncbi:MAG: helix-turn-helix transcriptional regulator [Pirellulaceae bacterium]|nr:helix-turn-helix transcriptional regulator [Pirellulaceae bacterium]
MTPRGNIAGIATITENLLKRKWSIVILRHLSRGLSDPAAIRQAEAELTPVAMNERLRTMLRYGLIVRHPPRVSAKAIEYHLTDRGHKVLRLLILIEQLDDLDDQDEISMDRLTGEMTPPPSEDGGQPSEAINRPVKNERQSLTSA